MKKKFGIFFEVTFSSDDMYADYWESVEMIKTFDTLNECQKFLEKKEFSFTPASKRLSAQVGKFSHIAEVWLLRE